MGKKLTIYLIEGNEYGPRSIEIGNWSGKAIYSPKSSLYKILSRNEFDNPGVYILKSVHDNDIFSEKIYVGEAENLRARIKQHLSNSEKEFTEFIGFISKDELLTKSHIRYLESRIIYLTKEAKTSEIDNATEPRLPMLHEADISDMEYFLEQVKLILPVVNFKALIPSITKKKISISEEEESIESNMKVYHIKNKNIDARMYESDQGFIVLSGSQCKKDTSKTISDGWIKLRKRLLDSGVIIENENSFIFIEDTIFPSLSAASSVILGRQSPGPLVWIDDEGINYKDNQKKEFAR